MTPERFEQLILENHRCLELFAAQWSDSPEDCVQEAFLRLFRCSESIENPRAWLFRVVRNLAIDSGRSVSSRRARESEFEISRRLFEVRPGNLIDGEELQHALEQLPGDLREIVVARIWGRLTFESISDAFDIAVSTAHRRYELGIQRLKQHFEVRKEQSDHE